LRKEPYDKWVGNIRQEITEQKAKKTKIGKALKTALKTQEAITKQTAIIKGFNESITTFRKKISENHRNAVLEGGKGWKKKAKMDLDECVLQIDGLVISIDKTEKHLKDVSTKINKAEARIESLEEELSNLTGLIGKKCPRCKQLVDAAHAGLLKERTLLDLEQEMKNLESETSSFNEATIEYDKRKAEIRKLEVEKQLTEKLRIYLEAEETNQREINRIRPKLKASEKKLKTLEANISKIDVVVLEREAGEIDIRIETLQNIVGEARTVQTNTPKKEKKEGALKTLNEQISGLETLSLSSTMVKVKTQIGSLEEKRDWLSPLLDKVGDLIGLEEQVRQTEMDIKMNETELGELESKFDSRVFEELTKHRDGLQSKETRLWTEVEILNKTQIPTAKEQFDESKRASDAIRDLRHDHERATKSLEVLSKIREFFREVQKPLRRRDIGRASTHATEIFKSLVGTHEYDRIRITEDHHLQISRFGELEPMSDLSGGEQVLAGLSVRLGFAKALANSELLILDEPTAFLDDTRKAELVQTLQYASPVKQMLIVTHDDEFQRVAQRVIRVQKDDATLVSNVSMQE
jgi:exonuclease SbcC